MSCRVWSFEVENITFLRNIRKGDSINLLIVIEFMIIVHDYRFCCSTINLVDSLKNKKRLASIRNR